VTQTKEHWEIEQDLRHNKTKEEIIEAYMELLVMCEQAVKQTKRVLERQ
jgi:hypothetical protein